MNSMTAEQAKLQFKQFEEAKKAIEVALYGEPEDGEGRSEDAAWAVANRLLTVVIDLKMLYGMSKGLSYLFLDERFALYRKLYLAEVDETCGICIYQRRCLEEGKEAGPIDCICKDFKAENQIFSTKGDSC